MGTTGCDFHSPIRKSRDARSGSCFAVWVGHSGGRTGGRAAAGARAPLLPVARIPLRRRGLGPGAPAKRSGRPPFPALWFPERLGGHSWRRHPRGAGQEVGARQPGAGRGGRGLADGGGLGDSGPLSSRRATRASEETMAKEEGDDRAVQRANRRGGLGRGAGAWLRPAGSGAAGGARP